MTARVLPVVGGPETAERRLRNRYDFADLTDRVRMPWRFQARHMAVDGVVRRR